MKIAFALLLLVFISGCAAPAYQKPLETQKSAVTSQGQIAPALDVKVYLVDLPATVNANSKFVVKWRVDSNQQKDITHTAVHYGSASVGGALSADVSPANSGYPSFTPEYASGNFKIPNEFSTAMVLESKGIIFARAHVIVDGKNYWSDEKSIQVE